MKPDFIIAIAVGGFCGSILRAWLGRTIPSGTFPLATFMVNILGSFAYGYFVQAHDSLTPWLSLALLTGFCGAFTTFSTMILESVILFRVSKSKAALLYLILSIFTSLLASACGFWLGSLHFGRL